MGDFQDLETYRNILESVQTGLCVVDVHKKIVFWSEGAHRISGHPRHEVIGHSCANASILHCDLTVGGVCPEDCPAAQAIRSAKPVQMTWQLHHKSGQKLFLEVKAAPVRNAHGSIIGAVETFTDAYPDAVAEQGRPEAWSAPGCVDPLTGITGHALMQCHLREALGTFAEMQVPFGVLRVRPEGLEQLRAKCGQEAASGLLRAIAQTIERALWGTDFVGRWNDDEFLVILNGCGEEALHAVRERIQRIASGAAIQWWGETRSLPLSFGEACVRRDDTAEILLERAGRSLIRDAARADIGAGAPHS